MLLAISAQTVFSVLITVLIILSAVLVILYILGRRLQAKQAMQQPMLEANTMEVSMLIIDKKKLRVKEAVAAGLPEQVVKVAVSGIYIRSIKSVRGGVVPEMPKQKGFFAKLRGKAEKVVKENGTEQSKKKK